MSLWEYKVISSGKGGFAAPAMMEKFLNDLGRDEWEIIHYHSQPENLLAFTGLARRSTQRDWTLADAAAAAAKAEADKLRAEFAAKFEAATRPASAAEEKTDSHLAEKSAPDDGLRKLTDTSRDGEPDTHADEPHAEKDEWDKLGEEDELPTFFDALKPHMRRNVRGPGMSVGTDYLAKKWELAEEDVKGALVECGMQIPSDEDAKPVYVEYDGDLFWVNINRRGELWINTREKPRPVFRTVQAQKVAEEIVEPVPSRRPEPIASVAVPVAVRPHFEPSALKTVPPENENQGAKGETTPAPAVPLPTGEALLETIRPFMRANRRGPGGSGSTTFLARALKCTEADLVAGFTALGLTVPANPNDKPVETEFGGNLWWVNKDPRGGIWINGREKRPGESAPAAAAPAVASAPDAAETPAPAAPVPTPAVEHREAKTENNSLSAVRLLLRETKTGSVAGKLDRVAEELGKSPADLLAALTAAGLKAPEKSREKPVFTEHAGEIFWLNLNAKDELWVNAKASKFAADEDDKKSRRPRPKKKD